MTDTVGDAILAAINSNWTGAGGTKPERYSKEDTQVMPDDPDFVWMLTDTADEDPRPFNNDFNIITTTIDMYVSSKQDANREQRLDTLLNEIKRIINPTNVTGFKQVRVMRIRRIPSDKRFGVFAAIVTFFLKSSLVSNKVTPGSSSNPTAEFDELTVNDWLKVPLIKSADGTDTIELLAGEATFPNDVNMESELKFSSASIHGGSNSLHMHPASGNEDILLELHPLGTNTLSKSQLRNAASPANYGALEFKVDGTTASINAITGGGGSPPTSLEINIPTTMSDDLLIYNTNINGNPEFVLGKDASDRIRIIAGYNSGTTQLDVISIITSSTGAGGNDGRFFFNIDGASCFLLNPNQTIQFYGALFPTTDKNVNIGITGTNRVDNVYADDFVNESPFKEFDTPILEIKKIKSKDGELDYESIPEWVRTLGRDRSKDKTTTVKNEMGEDTTIVTEAAPKDIVVDNGFSINRMVILLYQALQEATARIEALEAR